MKHTACGDGKMSESKKERFAALDCMRALGILYIVCFWHMTSYTDNELFKQIRSAPVFERVTFCVLACFTFMSGFLAYREFSNCKDVLKYYAKRIIRLWPLFALAAVFMVLTGINPAKTLPLVLCGLGWLKEPFPLTLWYVGMIFAFYVLNPVLSSKKLYVSIPCAVLAEGVFVIANRFAHTDERLWFYWPFFVIGSYACRFWGRKLPKSPGDTRIKAVYMIFAKISYASMCAFLYHRVFYTVLGKAFGIRINSVLSYVLSLAAFFGLAYLVQFAYDFLVGRIANIKKHFPAG